MMNRIDNEAARELILYAENTSELYERQQLTIMANLARKMKRGQYDAEKAAKLWGYMMDEAARMYCREFCENSARYYDVFNAATRREAARQYEEQQREEVEELANN